MVWVSDDSVMVARHDKGGALRAPGRDGRRHAAEGGRGAAPARRGTLPDDRRACAGRHVHVRLGSPARDLRRTSARRSRALGFTSEEWIQDPMQWESISCTPTMWRGSCTLDRCGRLGRLRSSRTTGIRSPSGARSGSATRPCRPDGSAGHPIYQGVMYDITERNARPRHVFASRRGTVPHAGRAAPGRDLHRRRRRHRHGTLRQPPVRASHRLHARRTTRGPGDVDAHAAPRRSAGLLAESDRTNQTGDDYDIEHRIVRKDGRVVVGARPCRSWSGRPTATRCGRAS